MILVEADASEEWDSRTDWAALAAGAVRVAVAAGGQARLSEARLRIEVSVRFTSDEEVRALNAAWRGKDKATNVLSFPMIGAPQLASLPLSDEGETLLGDIVLAHGVCVAEAGSMGVPVRDHAAHLVVHGMLHLLGYDHERGDAEAEKMEAAERRALAGLGISDPYEPALHESAR